VVSLLPQPANNAAPNRAINVNARFKQRTPDVNGFEDAGKADYNIAYEASKTGAMVRFQKSIYMQS
jgi:hypothetical protein